MVGIVLVSHSRPLALAVQELVRGMTGPALPLAIAAGAGDDHQELGTDAVEISEAILSVRGDDGVLVLMDMGSAILSAETALDLLDESQCTNIRFCAAPFVEGAVASGVTANLGSSLDEVCAEALAALKQKQVALNQGAASAPPAAPVREQNANASTIRAKVLNTHGLHARPAAKLITAMKAFHSAITVRNLANRRGPVSVKSLSSLASLEILQGNEVEFAAEGDDASAALEKIARLVEDGFGEAVVPAPKSPAPTKATGSKACANPLSVSGRVAIGPAVFFQRAQMAIPQDKIADVAAEIDRLQNAVTTAQKDLEQRRTHVAASVGAENAGIYEAQILALQDPELIEKAVGFIRTERSNAACAWNRANREVVSRYEALTDSYMRERAVDLEDVGQQVLLLLNGKSATGPALTKPAILVADNLTPFEVSSLPRDLVLGAILLDGGPTSHSSILLKAMGIPTLIQARTALAQADWNQANIVAFDGAAGIIWLNPGQRLAANLHQRQAEERARAHEEEKAAALPASTLDGHRVEVFANIGGATDVEDALQSGAEGVGLLRTEFLFMDRTAAPTEDEQIEALAAIAKKLDGRPIIVRTLDVGGDKAIPYLRMAMEENPFLGVRAVRLCFAQPELFATQLRAILRAGVGHDFRIMFPMIATVTDLDRAIACLEQAHRELEHANVPHLWPVQTGIMIEIPSAAIQAEALAQKADFFSIGTNDLTQYTLAADRGNPELSSYQDALHPSVLRLIEMVVRGARQHGRLVAVCGESASDERAAAILIGLGVQELSMSGAKIPRIKACLRKQNLATLQKLAQAALEC